MVTLSDIAGYVALDRRSGDAAGRFAPTANLLNFIRSTGGHARSIAKAISYRASSSLGTFAIAALITQNSKLAGGVALAEVVAKTGLYYAHERAWALIPWGGR